MVTRSARERCPSDGEAVGVEAHRGIGGAQGLARENSLCRQNTGLERLCGRI